MSNDLFNLVELNDSDELIREIDRRCASRDWEGLLELRNRCRLAVDRGKQLWGAAGHAEYRLALEAPGEYAAMVLDADIGRFGLGPLPEVAASTHQWAELEPYLGEGPSKGQFAYECAARGADLSRDASLDAYVEMFELPLALQSWEPAYATAVYRADEGIADPPAWDVLSTRPLVAMTDVVGIDDPDTFEALSALTNAWVAESNGSTAVAGVQGGVDAVLGILGCRDVDVWQVTPQSALAYMAWAAANGAAHARRPGLASGRSKTWWAVAALAGLLDEWPLASERLGNAVESLEWWTWASVVPADVGWSLRVVAVDPLDGVAFAVSSVDHYEA